MKIFRGILYLYLIFFSISVFSSCIRSNPVPEHTKTEEFAKHFSLLNYQDFCLLSIHDPWQKASGSEFTYCLTAHPENIPDSLSHLKIIQVPAKNYVVFSTTHAGFLKGLKKHSGIIGASGAKYLFDPMLSEKYYINEIAEVGYPPAINYEKIIEINPDIVFLYGLDPTVTGISERIEQAGISTIFVADYLETHPLGKLEWLKVFAALTETETMADSIIETVKSQYLELCQMTKNQSNKNPSVLLGMPWKDTWYMAGGNSITATFIHDAGGNYLWSENSSDEYIPLSVESVITKAHEADIWLNPGSVRSINEIIARDSRYRVFGSYQKGLVYNNDLQTSQSGSNNYWELGVIEPHLILKDMIKIFHPGILSEHDFVYYRKLK